MVILDMTKGLNHIGRLGENEHRTFRFPDSCEVLAMYPEATVSVLVKRPGDSVAYPVAPGFVEIRNGAVYWTVQSADLARIGRGNVELTFVDGTTVAKNIIYDVYVDKALDGAGDPPEPWESWQTDITAIAGEIAGDRAAAEQAAEDAIEAQGKAEAAQEAAESAEQGAGESAGAADTSARAAAESAGAADRSAGAADQSAQAAGRSANAADQSAQAAAGSVTAAGEQAGAADASARAAAASALEAERMTFGTEGGVPVPATSPYNENNAKHYAELTQAAETTAVQAINTAGSNQVTAVQNKGTQVLNSIPADYTELSGEVGNLKSAVSKKAWDIGSYNRFDVNKTTFGVITKTGATVASNDWVISDYMPVESGEVLYASVAYISAANFAIYDSDKNIVSNSNNWSNPYTVPNGVSYIKMSVDNNNKNKMYLSTINSFDSFKKIAPYIHEKTNTLNANINVLQTDVQDISTVINSTFDPYTDGNLIDKTKLSENKYVDGTIDGRGALKFANGFWATDYIPVKAGTQYYANQNYLFRGYAAFYDSNKTYISGYGNGAGQFWYVPLTAPQNAVYARFTILPANIANAWLSEANRMASKPQDYSEAINMRSQFVSDNPAEYTGNEISVFTKILCIGDSLTEGFFNENNGSRLVMKKRAYPAKLQALTGVECTNLGESGMTSAQWYTAHGSDDLSGYDACIIQLGVNDQLQNVSESDMDTALTSIITKIKTDNNNIKVFVATVIPANGYMTAAMRTRSQMIRDFVANLNDANVYIVDLWTYGHTDDYLAYDAGHLSALGYLRLAEDYKAYISYIIRHNINAFRYVQFIGTNYAYSGMTYIRDIEY